MLPKYHIILGAIFSIIIYFIFPISIFQATIIFLASFLIDIDHYLVYVYKKKDINPLNSVKYFFKIRSKYLKLSKKQREQYKKPHFIFHGIETILLLYLLSLVNGIFLFILIGVIFHLILDYLEIIYYDFDFYDKASQIYLYYKNKGKRKSFL